MFVNGNDEELTVAYHYECNSDDCRRLIQDSKRNINLQTSLASVSSCTVKGTESFISMN
jgi:hypothetical protein